MHKPTSKKATHFLQEENHDLQSLFAKVKLLEVLNQKVAACLDVNLVQYCQVANVVNQKLILVAANGSIATQIRFQNQDLLRKLKKDPLLKDIQAIECKVRPVTTNPATRLPPNTDDNKPFLSHATADIIHAMADAIEDPKIREIMLRIATRKKDST